MRANWAIQNFAVRSVGDHWALGARADVDKNTHVNQDLFEYTAGVVEWSLFPIRTSPAAP